MSLQVAMLSNKSQSHFEFLAGEVKEICITTQAIAIAVGCPLKLDYIYI